MSRVRLASLLDHYLQQSLNVLMRYKCKYIRTRVKVSSPNHLRFRSQIRSSRALSTTDQKHSLYPSMHTACIMDCNKSTLTCSAAHLRRRELVPHHLTPLRLSERTPGIPAQPSLRKRATPGTFQLGPAWARQASPLTTKQIAVIHEDHGLPVSDCRSVNGTSLRRR